MTNCEWCGLPMNAQRSTKKFCSAKCKQASHRADQEIQIEANMLTLPLEDYPKVSFWLDLGDIETAEKLSRIFSDHGIETFRAWSDALQWNHAITMSAAMQVLAANLDTQKPDDTIH